MKKGPKVCLLSSAFTSITVYFVAFALVLLSLVDLLLLEHLHFIFLYFLMGSYLRFIYYFLGLLPIIGELKFCGKVLEDAGSIYYDDQLASEQKCVDVVIDGMHVHYLFIEWIASFSTIFLGYYSCMDTRTHEDHLAFGNWHVCFPCSPCLVALLVGKKNLPVEKSPFVYS